MPITAPPTIPQITDPSTFATRAQAWVVWQSNELYPAIADTASILSLSTSSTSTTSNTIGTGSKSFTVETGKGYLAGQSLSIARTSAPTNRMFAVVTSYNSGTGALVVNVQAIEGSGTFTDWSIALAFNGVIGTGQIANEAVTLAKLARVGTAGQVLTSGGTGADASYTAIADASETVKGIVELATNAEAIAGTANKIIDGAKLKSGLNASGSAPIFACRAWVNFNGTGTVAIRASGNVSSITDNGTGDYTVNFTTAIADANYAVALSAVRNASNSDLSAQVKFGGTYTAAAVQVTTGSQSVISIEDAPVVNVMIFR